MTIRTDGVKRTCVQGCSGLQTARMQSDYIIQSGVDLDSFRDEILTRTEESGTTTDKLTVFYHELFQRKCC